MNISDEPINIVYASDENFSEIMGISILSLFENNKNADIKVYIFESGISDESKGKINLIFQQYEKRMPTWVKAINIENILGLEVKQDRGSMSQFSRLFISRLLPEEIERVLYLDCDIIVNDSIQQLWNMDLKGNIIAALKDPFSKYYRRILGLDDEAVLFNSGVMLIDVKKWKCESVEVKLLQFIKKYNGCVPSGDQGALGAILSDDTTLLEPKYNVVTLFYDFSYEEMLTYRKPSGSYYSKNKIEEAKRNPVLVHFTTSFASIRPWFENGSHPYRDEYLRYKMMSPWKDTGLRKYIEAPWWKKTYIKLYTRLPRFIAIRISGFLQAYGRPILIKMKYRI